MGSCNLKAKFARDIWDFQEPLISLSFSFLKLRKLVNVISLPFLKPSSQPFRKTKNNKVREKLVQWGKRKRICAFVFPSLRRRGNSLTRHLLYGKRTFSGGK